MAFFSRCDNPSRFATDLVKLATRSKRTSTRASSKSDEKVQAASLQKGRKRMAALQLLAPLARPRSQLKATPRLRENYVIAPVVGKKIRSRARSLLIVVDHLRRRSATADSSCGEFARCKLCAHLLDLRCLLFELGAQELNFIPLL